MVIQTGLLSSHRTECIAHYLLREIDHYLDTHDLNYSEHYVVIACDGNEKLKRVSIKEF